MLNLVLDRTQPIAAELVFYQLSPRTVPLALMGVLGLLGLVAIGVLYHRKRHLRGTVAEQFKGFREKAVALMDQLDGLRQRHKTLPATDPDFTAPLSGATLALYNEVEADLNGLWDRWLKAMEVWDKVQKLIRAGSELAIKQTEEARKLLEEGDIDELIRQSNSCKERLDRLNRGHEQARDALKAGQRELAALRKSFDQSAEAGLSTVSNPKEIATAETMLTLAEGMIPADPIGAEEIIVRSRQVLAAATVRPDQKPTRPREARPTYGPVDEVAAAAKFRSVMARLELTNLMGFFVRAWIAVWALALLIGLLTPLMPLVLFVVLGFGVILAGLWAIWRTVAIIYKIFRNIKSNAELLWALGHELLRGEGDEQAEWQLGAMRAELTKPAERAKRLQAERDKRLRAEQAKLADLYERLRAERAERDKLLRAWGAERAELYKRLRAERAERDKLLRAWGAERAERAELYKRLRAEQAKLADLYERLRAERAERDKLLRAWGAERAERAEQDERLLAWWAEQVKRAKRLRDERAERLRDEETER